MNSIHLEKIDENNFLQAFGLKLGEGQDKFVSHPIRSLAQAYVYAVWHFLRRDDGRLCDGHL